MTIRFGIGRPVFGPRAAATPATMAPPWMRQEELRTVACMRPSTTAWIAGGIASTPPIRIFGSPVRLHDAGCGKRHVVVVEERSIDLRERVEIPLPQLRCFRDLPIRRIGRQNLDTGKLVDDRVEASSAALRAGMSERACVMMIVPWPPIASASAWVTAAPMNSLSGARNVRTSICDLIERRDQRVHVDHRDPGLDHPDDWRSDRVDVHRLDGDEVRPFRCNLLDESQLFRGRELGIEPGDVDVEQPTPVLGGLFPLRAPGDLQADVENAARRRLRERPAPAPGCAAARRLTPPRAAMPVAAAASWQKSRRPGFKRDSGSPKRGCGNMTSLRGRIQ